jgi:hypothetical protein
MHMQNRWLALVCALGGVCVAIAANAQEPGRNMVLITSPAAEGSRQLCAAKCVVHTPYITTGAAAGFLMLFDQASATPAADGAVVPVLCIQVAATTSSGPPAPTTGMPFQNGALAVFSTTGCFTKTISATAYFSAVRQTF